MSALFLGEMFENLGYEVILIHRPYQILPGTADLCTWIQKIYPTVLVLEESVAFSMNAAFDIIFQLGYFYDKKTISAYKQMNPTVKVVAFIVDCLSITDMEHMVYTENNLNYHAFKYLQQATIQERRNFCEVDQVWISPEHETTNAEYLQFYLNCAEVTVVPFIWSPKISEFYASLEKLKPCFEKNPTLPSKAVAIREPNISLTRSCIIPTYICERYHREHKNIKNIFILSGKEVGKHRKFLQVIDGTTIRDITSVEENFNPIQFLNQYADVIVSHQWNRPLNQLYLEVAWWGWPIVHNGTMCKDIGYFYSDFDVTEGAEMLRRAMATHAKNAAKYQRLMRRRISRYLPDHPRLMEDFQILVQDLTFGRFKRWNYCAETNSLL